MDLALEKSKAFSVRIVKLYQYLCAERKEFVISRQILKAGTSIGANLTEAKYAFSTRDYAAKKSIALKESAETVYWLELLHNTGYLSDPEFSSMAADCEEILKILIATVKKIKDKK
ncbi:MAG: four helix bundle protein [Treponema sp.]|jgi:four helix bundle protein|nr:four helix bundle protein [Treponema sp.]